MSKPTIADEQEFRAALVAELETIDLAGSVFDRRRSISSRKDFFAKLGQVVNNKTEIRFVEVDLLNIVDSDDEGPDDCPVTVLTYGIHAFHEFADARSDNSNSDADFNELLFRLRTKFLNKREWILNAWVVETFPIDQSQFTQIGNDGFTDVLGHSKDLFLTANFYDPT